MDLARETAFKILYRVDTEKAYSNLILDEVLNKYRDKLTNKDINFISEIVYGTISWRISIDTIIEKYSNIKLKKISDWVLNILRIGIYQIIFLDKVPKSAAVNESVKLAKKYAIKSVGFVNAILRKIQKSDYEEFANIKDTITRISKMYSMPDWIVEALLKEYTTEEVENICKYSNEKPKTTIRINSLKITKEEFVKKLASLEIEYEETEISDFLHIKNLKNIGELDLFKEGLFTVQDIGAGHIGMMLFPKPGETVLDACSAPGGKTSELAEIMQNKGKIVACDIHQNRLNLVEETKQRLGIDIIKTVLQDATMLNENFIDKFDKVLIDVPCLGLGVIKRKPDIKYQRNKEDIEEIAKIQYKILENCSQYLKKGGELVYSTCSLLKEENEDVINKWINTNKYEIKEQQKILPDENTDGFYICKIKKT